MVSTLFSCEIFTSSGLTPGTSATMRIASASSKTSTAGAQAAAAPSPDCPSGPPNASFQNRVIRCSRLVVSCNGSLAILRVMVNMVPWPPCDVEWICCRNLLRASLATGVPPERLVPCLPDNSLGRPAATLTSRESETSERRGPSPSLPLPSIFHGLMIHTATVGLPPAEVLARAKAFFAERVPHASAFPEKEGPQFVLLRGQGGEELVISARPPDEGGDRGGGTSYVRASTLFFDQALDRFFSTLPLESEVEIA